MSRRVYTILIALLFLGGCVSKPSPSTPSFDSELYDGKDVNSLASKEAPKTEKEAIQRADRALSQNQVDLALFEYIRSLSLPSGEYKDKTLYTIGRIHQSRDNLPLAEKAYLMALKANPQNIQVLEQLGANQSKQGSVARGKGYFLRAINADLVRLNRADLQLKEPLSSQEVLALSVDNDSPGLAYMGLGVLYDTQNAHLLAQAFYRQALKITPECPKCLINMGYSYYMSGNYNEAERTMMAALAIDENNEKAQNNLALIYLAQNKPQKALSVFKAHMDEFAALNNVGYFLMLQGKPELAVPYLQQAIDKNPYYYKTANENLDNALLQIRMKAGEAK